MLAAQTPPQEVRVSSRPYVGRHLRVDTSLVDVGVVVRDARGRAVAGLRQSDFQVLDEGTDRAITSFTVDTSRAGTAPAAAPNPTPGPSTAAAASTGAAHWTRFVVLFFDDANTNAGDLTHAQIAARRFVKEALSPGDNVAILTSAAATPALDFTTDTAKMVEAIGLVRAHQRVPDFGLTACPRVTPYQAYLIAVRFDTVTLKAAVDDAYACQGRDPTDIAAYTARIGDPMSQTIKGQADQTWDRVRVVSQSTLDSLDAALVSLAKMPGRRVLVLVSSGFLSASLEANQDSLVDRALRAGITLNALDAKGVYSEAPVRAYTETTTATPRHPPISTFVFDATSVGSRLEALDAPLASLSASTGGLFFRNNNDLDLGFREIGMEPEVTYHLGFSPSPMTEDGKYHRLKVKLVGSNNGIVQARPGYFAGARTAVAEKKDADAEARDRIDRAVLSQEVVSAFPVTVAVKPGRPLNALASVDVTQLRFSQQNGRRLQRLTFVAALLDSQGNLVAGKEGVMELNLTDASYSKMAQTGLRAGLTLDAPPGSYLLREVVHEAVENRITTALQPVEIPAH